MKNIRYIFPNLITLLNLLSGSVAIVFVFENQLMKASFFILAAAVFDLLDGLVARLINATSEFGKELDSLCDLVSFGVAPSALLYQILVFTIQKMGVDSSQALPAEFPLLVQLLPFGAFLFAVASALRLARFNVTKSKSNDFIGMPVPAATITVIAYFWTMKFTTNPLIHDILWSPILVFSLAILIGFLMVSRLKMISFKFEKGGLSPNIFRYLLVIISLVLLLIFNKQALFFIMLSYILLSLLSSLPVFYKKEC